MARGDLDIGRRPLDSTAAESKPEDDDARTFAGDIDRSTASSPIEEACEILMRVHHNLDSSLRELFERLSPILSKEATEGNADNRPVNGAGSDLYLWLNERISIVESMRSRVLVITEQIEL